MWPGKHEPKTRGHRARGTGHEARGTRHARSVAWQTRIKTRGHRARTQGTGHRHEHRARGTPAVWPGKHGSKHGSKHGGTGHEARGTRHARCVAWQTQIKTRGHRARGTGHGARRTAHEARVGTAHSETGLLHSAQTGQQGNTHTCSRQPQPTHNPHAHFKHKNAHDNVTTVYTQTGGHTGHQRTGHTHFGHGTNHANHANHAHKHEDTHMAPIRNHTHHNTQTQTTHGWAQHVRGTGTRDTANS